MLALLYLYSVFKTLVIPLSHSVELVASLSPGIGTIQRTNLPPRAVRYQVFIFRCSSVLPKNKCTLFRKAMIVSIWSLCVEWKYKKPSDLWWRAWFQTAKQPAYEEHKHSHWNCGCKAKARCWGLSPSDHEALFCTEGQITNDNCLLSKSFWTGHGQSIIKRLRSDHAQSGIFSNYRALFTATHRRHSEDSSSDADIASGFSKR